MFYFEEINGYKFLKSDLLSEIKHYFTTKTNPHLDIKDWVKIIYPNSQNIITPQQTHSDNVVIVSKLLEYPNTDGLIITQKEQPIGLRFADCTPLIFYDTRKKIGAVTHAGWRGTAQKIAVKTIKKMNSNPKDIKVIIGPAIGLCCYEVSDDVKETLLNTVIETKDLTQISKVDLKQINARQLLEIGVNKIDICPFCTSCNNDLFYSYRKENGTQKRHYAMLML